MAKIKSDIDIVRKNGLYYTAENGNRPRRFKPWPGTAFLFCMTGSCEALPAENGALLYFSATRQT